MALAFLGTAGTAFAQRVDTFTTGANYVGDEAVPTGAGTLTYNWENSPSGSWLAEDTGIPAALGGTWSTILDVKFQHRYCAYAVTCAGVDQNSILNRLSVGKFMLPGQGQFVGYFGDFNDLDGNGWIDDGNNAYNRVHTSLEQDCGGVAGLGSLSTTDPSGLGQPQGANTGVAFRCGALDEWVPPTADEVIVVYVTPGQFPAGNDNVNRWFNHWNPLTKPAVPNAQEAPDFSMKGTAIEGAATGQYYSPSTNFDYVMLDGSLLQTTVSEAISAPEAKTSGSRTHEAKAGSRVDVDVYSSVDPVAEGMFQTTLISALVGAGCNPDHPEQGCRATTDTYTEPVRQQYEGVLASVGATKAQIYTPYERDPQNLADRSSAHLYLDLLWEASTSMGLGASHWSSNCGEIDYPGIGCEVSPKADGQKAAWPQVAVNGFFGVWTDSNGDGWIGTPDLTAACPNDPYQCGAVNNPHNYSDPEFVAACGAKDEPIATRTDGNMLVTLTSSTNTWGANGVYVLTDRYDVRNNNADTLRDDGRVPFNPYDDAVADATGLDGSTAGSFESLRKTGPIELHLVCRDQGGFYASYERLLFLDGKNEGYDISYGGTTTGNFAALGVPQGETVTDDDLIPQY